MPKVPEEDREFLRNNKQVFKPGAKRGTWLTIEALRAAVLAGTAEGWHVVDIDFETSEPRIICPRCDLGIEHKHSIH